VKAAQENARVFLEGQDLFLTQFDIVRHDHPEKPHTEDEDSEEDSDSEGVYSSGSDAGAGGSSGAGVSTVDPGDVFSGDGDGAGSLGVGVGAGTGAGAGDVFSLDELIGSEHVKDNVKSMQFVDVGSRAIEDYLNLHGLGMLLGGMCSSQPSSILGTPVNPISFLRSLPGWSLHKDAPYSVDAGKFFEVPITHSDIGVSGDLFPPVRLFPRPMYLVRVFVYPCRYLCIRVLVSVSVCVFMEVLFVFCLMGWGTDESDVCVNQRGHGPVRPNSGHQSVNPRRSF
jgi:hypothetical protein